MSNISRFRRADPKRAEDHPVDSAVVVTKGNMMWLNTNDARPVTSFTYVTGDLQGTQANFAALFIGIALDKSASGDTADISIGTEGIYEMDCAAAQFEIGDLVGPDDNAAPDALVDKVIAVGENGAAAAMGRVVRRYSANTTRVIVELLPRKQVSPQMIPIYSGLITAAADMVTDWAVTYPFKLNRLHSVVSVLTAGACAVTVENGATALDDGHTIADAAPVGAVDVTVMDDATGDDIFIVGDTLTLVSDGTPTAGEALFFLEVTPFLREL